MCPGSPAAAATCLPEKSQAAARSARPRCCRLSPARHSCPRGCRGQGRSEQSPVPGHGHPASPGGSDEPRGRLPAPAWI